MSHRSKQMVIHDTAVFVAWCYGKEEGVLDQRRSE
nr:MAG TPA_asm: hypothetical protein [Caudoviricetes sp.]